MDPVFWHRALYGAYLSLMNAFFWVPEEERAIPPSAIDKVRAIRMCMMHTSVKLAC